MDHHTFSEALLQVLLIQAPVLLACALGLLFSMRFWRLAPAAARWCAAAFLLALAGSGLTIYSWLADEEFVGERIVPILRAATYLLLLIGVFVGRSRPVTDSKTPSTSLWQPLLELLPTRPWLKSLFRAAFVGTFLLVFVWSVIMTFIRPETFSSTSRVRLNFQTNNPAAGIVAENYSRQIQTECEVLQSEAVLATLVENGKLGLKERWSQKFNSSEPLSTSQTVALLKRQLAVSPVHNANIIEISLYSDRPEEAAELANALAEDYCHYTLAQTSASNSASVGKLPPAVAEIIDRAKPNRLPVRPNKSLDISLGFWGAFWMATAVGLLVVWVSLRFEKQIAPPGSKDGAEAGQAWVTAQNGLGASLRDQARKSSGAEALRLLDESAKAYQTVLSDGIRERFPLGWAMAQNNLGVLLRDRAEWSPLESARILLQAAVIAHRAALEVYARDLHPRHWSTTQNNLSLALRDQASRSEGAEAIRLLNEAVAANRAALQS